jgi:hypothetical protein
LGRARLHGAPEAGQLVRALALDAQGQQDGAQLQRRHRAIQHGAEQGLGLLGTQVAGAACAAADFLDQGGELHGASVGAGVSPGLSDPGASR